MLYNEVFDKYLLILKEWNKKINLVQKDTLNSYFERHIKDSLQITDFIDINDRSIFKIDGFKRYYILLLCYEFQAEEKNMLFT